MALTLRLAQFAAGSCITWAAILYGLSRATAETAYFLVTELPEDAVHGDSYVLPLSDPAAIAHARALVAEPGTLASIAVAHIAAGPDGINRDHLASGTPGWSWHVTGFEGFTDFAIEILDGWPTYVEQDVAGWIANTDGMIGFWNYTVTAELDLTADPAGDFDGDHDVDAADLVQWQSDFGLTGGSDADGDGQSDGADFLVWQRHLGTNISPSSAAAVPELSAFIIAASSLVALSAWRQNLICGRRLRRR
jgi:hypothetical protein